MCSSRHQRMQGWISSRYSALYNYISLPLPSITSEAKIVYFTLDILNLCIKSEQGGNCHHWPQQIIPYKFSLLKYLEET